MSKKDKIIELQEKADRKRGLSPIIAQSFMEDEYARVASKENDEIRREAIQRSHDYLVRKHYEKRMPWYIIFLTGGLFFISLEIILEFMVTL